MKNQLLILSFHSPFRYVLSAAHCFTSPDITAETVRLGELDLRTEVDCSSFGDGKELCAPPVQEIPLASVTVHPDYSGRPPYLHDVALVRLASAVELNGNVRPVCLPLDPSAAAAEMGLAPGEIEGLGEGDGGGRGSDGRSAKVVGWGRLEYDEPGDIQVRVHWI